MGVSAAIYVASAVAAGATAYSVDQSNQQKRLASQKADAAKQDTAAAENTRLKIEDRNQNQAAMFALARRNRASAQPNSAGSYSPQPTLLGGAPGGGKTLLGM